MLNSSAIVDTLNIFQTHLDEFDVPCLTYNQLKPYLNQAQRAQLAFTLNNLSPLVAVNRVVQDDDVVAMLLKLDGTTYQQNFVRVSPIIFKRFEAMKSACMIDTGKQLSIASGYRSPTYQALLLYRVLYDNRFDLAKTLREVNPPGYSNHQNAANPAIDIAVGDDEHSDDDFKTTAYPWLQAHAKTFGFYEPYSRNQTIMAWEPWHWHYSA